LSSTCGFRIVLAPYYLLMTLIRVSKIWDVTTTFTIQYIQDIKIINAFHDAVSDIKTVEEITMKKAKTVAELLAIADMCIEVFRSLGSTSGVLRQGALNEEGRSGGQHR
jgi:hypothetical protein